MTIMDLVSDFRVEMSMSCCSSFTINLYGQRKSEV